MELSVKIKLESYPKDVAILLKNIRDQILSVATEIGIQKIEETLKWGEPSYSAKHGSAIRFDWKAKFPNQYCLYFNCNTKLIETFKELYGNTFSYDGNRALVFQLDDKVPIKELRHCIAMALNYHKLKQFPLLGA